MSTEDLWRGWLAEALMLHQEARRAFERQAWFRVVRLSAEAIELAQKTLLAFCGIYPPHAHNVAGAVDRLSLVRERLDIRTRRALRNEAEWLAKQRNPSFYGDDKGRPPSMIYKQAHAERALEITGRIINIVQQLTSTPEESP